VAKNVISNEAKLWLGPMNQEFVFKFSCFQVFTYYSLAANSRGCSSRG